VRRICGRIVSKVRKMYAAAIAALRKLVVKVRGW